MFYQQKVSSRIGEVEKTHVIMYREGWVLRTSHLAIFVAFSQSMCTRSIAQLCSLGEEFYGILAIDKQDVVNTAFVKKCELVKGVRELRVGAF